MDVIQALLNDFKNKKINDGQLQEQLASLIEPNATSESVLASQVEDLKNNYQLPQHTCDAVKTIVTESFSAKTVLTNSLNAKTVVADNNATQVVQNDNTVVRSTHQTPRNPDISSGNSFETAETIVSGTQGISAEKQTLHEHTNNYFDPNRQPSKSVILKPGSIIKNRFILEDELGHGGMSIVYRALDLRKQEANNRDPYIAVKILGDAFKNHPQSIRVLEHESQKIQSLAHPNIITVYDFDRDADVIYMTMECLQGQSLDVLVRDNKTGIPINEALRIIEGISRALFYAHSKNIIHSDLKPENVFITQENVVKVLDFGIARAKKIPGQSNKKSGKAYVDFDGSNLGALTPPYASPEMFEDADPDPRDDIYALGCVTYQLFTGHHPFDGKQSNHARDAAMIPKKINELSRKQWNTLSSSLAFDREHRVATIAEFLDGMVPKKRTLWFYAGIAGTSIALAISAYSWYSASQKPMLPIANLSIEQKQKINQFFETADLYFSMGYLASPPGDSAYDQYQKVLEIDPTNQAAIEGNKKVANQYKKLALHKFESGDLAESLLLVKTGLIVQPDNKDLLDFQMEIHQKQTKK
ncbi:MAG: serine/threonine protein kinase [Gammaproteobacteria bacterium]|nr:serine/threonine protein kinase [Gammaproteobacteria bacterium]